MFIINVLVAEKSMKMSCGSDNDGMKWEELGITQLLSSQIQAFETSDFYDCTFRVGSSSAHKVCYSNGGHIYSSYLLL